MGIIKTYKAKTDISINVVLPGKKNLHVSFSPRSDGSSVFSTDNEDVQKAIERHSRFGSLFRLYSSKSQDAQEKEAAGAKAEQAASRKSAPRKVRVTDISSAKDYLADRFGVSRTLLRSAKSIREQATAHGIEFEGI